MDFERIDISSFPLRHEVFARKEELGEQLALRRAELREAEAAAARRFVKRFVVWSCTVAAAAVVLAAVFMLQVTTVTTGASGQRVMLPCGSIVEVGAYSEISYQPRLWKWLGRTVDLDGTACFDVARGNEFTVKTDLGTVSVLGTEFKVSEQDTSMVVQCFEGSVGVKPADGEATDEVVLAAGEEVVVTAGKKVEVSLIGDDDASEKAAEKEEEEASGDEVVVYRNEPLANVVAEMERRFGINVVNAEECEGIVYSGNFYAGDKDLTLEMVFMSCGLDYTVNGNDVVLKKIE